MAELTPAGAAEYAACFLARWVSYADGSSDEPPGDLAPEYLRVLLAERDQLRRDLDKTKRDRDSWQHVAAGRESEITRLRSQRDEIAGYLPIEELTLDRRAYNILKAAGIRHIGEITRRTEDELYQLRNMGKISMRNIKDRLRDEFGLTLRQDAGAVARETAEQTPPGGTIDQ